MLKFTMHLRIRKSVAKGQGLSTPMCGELVKGMDREDVSGITASPPTFFYLKLSIKNNEEKESLKTENGKIVN
jgi:hypothetical protein